MKRLEQIASKVAGITSAIDADCYLVGGIVRNALLGINKGDIDLTCKLSPEELLQGLKNFRTIPTGLQHQTITVVNPELSGHQQNIEITSFRALGMKPEGGLVLGLSLIHI